MPSQCKGKRNTCSSIPGCKLTKSGKRLSYCRKGSTKRRSSPSLGRTRNARMKMFRTPTKKR